MTPAWLLAAHANNTTLTRLWHDGYTHIRHPRGDNVNHGTTTGYKTHGCRCEPCRRAATRSTKRWRMRTGADLKTSVPAIPDLIDVTPVREHVEQLVATGWLKRDIAGEVGLTGAALYEALYKVRRGGGVKRINRRTAAAILALEPLTPLPANYIDHVIVDRLIAGADWRTIGANRAERITAAETLWHHWQPIRERQAANHYGSQQIDGPSLADIERRFSLRAGRDFRRHPNETPTRGAA